MILTYIAYTESHAHLHWQWHMWAFICKRLDTHPLYSLMAQACHACPFSCVLIFIFPTKQNYFRFCQCVFKGERLFLILVKTKIASVPQGERKKKEQRLILWLPMTLSLTHKQIIACESSRSPYNRIVPRLRNKVVQTGWRQENKDEKINYLLRLPCKLSLVFLCYY